MNHKIAFLFCIIIGFALADFEKNWALQKSVYSSLFKNLESNDFNDLQRFEVFKQNMKKIQDHNSDSDNSFKMKQNIFTHLSPNEFQKLLGKKLNLKSKHLPGNKKKPVTFEHKLLAESPLDKIKKIDRIYVNWAKKFSTPVAYQGACGGCYAFAASGAIETLLAIKTKSKPIELSKQQILDCTFLSFYDTLLGIDGNLGCQGGYSDFAFEYAKQFGLQSEANYSFVNAFGGFGKNGFSKRCNYNKDALVTYISDYKLVDSTNIQNLKQAVKMTAVTAYIYADDNFQNYGSGIIKKTELNKDIDCDTQVNHAVLIVGYGIEKGTEYWIVKNSWSNLWGEAGYFRVEMGNNTNCIEQKNYFPVIDDTEDNIIWNI